MDPDDVEEIRRYSPSGTSKTLRACLRCRQIMNKEQFVEYGCPNCRDTLAMQGSEPRVLACTTSNFQGFMTLIRPGAFASRFIGLEHRRPGCYALTTKGSIPDHILHESDAEQESEIGRRRRYSVTPTSGGGGTRKMGESSAEEDALSQTALKSRPSQEDTTAVPEEAPTVEAPTAEVPTDEIPTEDVPVPPSPPSPAIFSNTPPTLATPPLGGVVSPGVGGALGGITPEGSQGGSTPKRRRLEAQAGQQDLILEPEGDAEFGGAAGL